MERVSQFRGRALIALFALLMCFFAYRMYELQVVETGGQPVDNSTYYVTKTRVKAARGDILDCNGNVLVGNRASYDLVINHYVLTSSADPNESIYRLVMLCKELGIEYNENFPVTRERPFTYTLDQYNTTWQRNFQTYLQERGNYDSDITAPLLIQTLRKSYGIPEEWTDEEARLVIGIRYELSLRGYVRSLPSFVFLSDATDEERFAISDLNIPGMNVEATTVREYYTDYATHIIGYTGAMNDKEWEQYKDLGYSMDAEVGKSGFELAFEEELHGTDGWRWDTVAPDGTLISSKYDPAPKAGNNVETTIDISLQMTAEDQLEIRLDELRAQEEGKDGQDAEGGAVVVMEVKTGKILACASNPSYSPDIFTDKKAYAAILEAENDPLYNRALSGAYPPGSTFKPCMVIAGVRANFINMDTLIEDKGIFMKYAEAGQGDFHPECLHYTQSFHTSTHGFINAAKALCVSCNYFFYEVADNIPLEVMDSTAAALGLGEPTGVELPEEIGHRANEETKKKLYKGTGTRWYAADQVVAGIGQSDHRFTPLQLCVYASTLANKGTRYSATFLNRIVSTDYRSLIRANEPQIANHLDIPNDAVLSYMEGMKMVAGNPEGTGYKVFGKYPIQICAKTGTAETDSGGSDNGMFICFAPADDPKIAIAIYGEQAGHGSSMAIVARYILDAYFEVGELGDVTTYENQVC